MNKVYQVKNFISQEQIETIISGFKALKIETNDPYVKTFNGSFISLPQSFLDQSLIVRSSQELSLSDEDYVKYLNANKVLNKILTKQLELIKDTYQNNIRQRFLNYVVTETGGGYDGYHTDSASDSGEPRMPQGMDPAIWDKIDGRWNDSGRYWYSAILYLNSDYNGGEIEFLDYIKIKPEAGELVYFIGDKDTQHGVRKVLSGERHALISFYWDDMSYNMYKDLLEE
jgi:RimJ/RimL family protein N-acetyltransferase